MSSVDRIAKFGGIPYEGTPTCYVIGAGSRGTGYAKMALENPEYLNVVGVAELVDERRVPFAEDHRIHEKYVCNDWTELLEMPKIADFVIVATQDHQHAAPAIAAMKKGYHVLVEKPMATTKEDCEEMVRVAEEEGVMLGVCHVLDYTPYTRAFKKAIGDGEIGKVHSINHVEPVGAQHFAHSYVRGLWRNQQVALHILGAKSSHDFAWIAHVTGCDIAEVICRGSLTHFTQSEQPSEAKGATRCVECPIKKDCVFSATQYYTQNYIDKTAEGKRPGFGYGAVTGKPGYTLGDIEDAVANGPYGRCVYGGCDNDQPDLVHALLTLEDKDGHEVRGTFEMRALTEKVCERLTTVCGPKGEITGDMQTIKIVKFGNLREHTTTEITPISLTPDDTQVSGHWGADWFLTNAFCAAVARKDPSLFISPQSSLTTHLAIFKGIEDCTRV